MNPKRTRAKVDIFFINTLFVGTDERCYSVSKDCIQWVSPPWVPIGRCSVQQARCENLLRSTDCITKIRHASRILRAVIFIFFSSNLCHRRYKHVYMLLYDVHKTISITSTCMFTHLVCQSVFCAASSLWESAREYCRAFQPSWFAFFLVDGYEGDLRNIRAYKRVI